MLHKFPCHANVDFQLAIAAISNTRTLTKTITVDYYIHGSDLELKKIRLRHPIGRSALASAAELDIVCNRHLSCDIEAEDTAAGGCQLA